MSSHHLMQAAGEETPKELQCSRETPGLVYEASAIVGKGKEILEEGGGAGSAGQQTRAAEAKPLDSMANPESPDPKSIMVSSTESLVKAATVATTSNQPEAVLVNKAGPSGARVAGYDEEEIRLRAQMKAAALEQGSDDDEVVPPGGGMRPNAWVNNTVLLMGVLINVRLDFPVLQQYDPRPIYFFSQLFFRLLLRMRGSRLSLEGCKRRSSPALTLLCCRRRWRLARQSRPSCFLISVLHLPGVSVMRESGQTVLLVDS